MSTPPRKRMLGMCASPRRAGLRISPATEATSSPSATRRCTAGCCRTSARAAPSPWPHGSRWGITIRPECTQCCCRQHARPRVFHFKLSAISNAPSPYFDVSQSVSLSVSHPSTARGCSFNLGFVHRNGARRPPRPDPATRPDPTRLVHRSTPPQLLASSREEADLNALRP